MKKSIQFLGFCILGISLQISVIAQKSYSDDSIALKKRIYKISILTSDSKKISGYLASLSDSNLYLSSSPLRLSLHNLNNTQSSYPYDHLEKIEIRRKGAAGRGAWKGALIGLVTGAIAGYASGDDPVSTYNNPNDPFGTLFTDFSNAFSMTAGEKAVALGFGGAVTGALIGTVVGTFKRKFILGRNKEKFHAMSQNILERLYTH